MSVLMNQIIRAIATPYMVEEILVDVKRVTSFCADCGTIEQLFIVLKVHFLDILGSSLSL